MADRIAISPEDLNNVGDSLVDASTQIAELMSSMNSQVEGLEANWSGAAQISYFEEYEARKQNVEAFQEMIKVFGEQLKAVATNMQEADDALASALKGGV